MCLSIVARVEKILENGDAVVVLSDVKKQVSLSLLPEPVKEGEWVLIHTGYAIAKVDEEKALETVKAFEYIDSL